MAGVNKIWKGCKVSRQMSRNLSLMIIRTRNQNILGSPKETDSEEDFLLSPIDLFPFIRRQSGKIEEREIRSRSSNSHLSLFVICASSIVTLRI